MSNLEKMIEELLKNQRKLAEDMASQKEIIQHIQEKVERLETVKPETTNDIPPSLLRVLIGLAESDKPLTTEETADKISLSRNLVSNYLNRLLELGYVTKEPNLSNPGSRYLFSTNYSAIPGNIKEILKKYEK